MLDLSHEWQRFTYDGREYAARLEYDQHHGAPWEECTGHGPVTDWESRDKRPGDLILSEDNRGRAKRFYDFQEACAIARRDGWSAAPYVIPGESKRAQAARAARADFERLRAWCNDDWYFVGVIVAPVCPCCDEIDESEAASLWGIESDAGAYLSEVALELTAEIPAREAA